MKTELLLAMNKGVCILLNDGKDHVPDIANLDEWDTPCPSECGNNVRGIIDIFGMNFGYCSKCNKWYDLKTGKAYANPMNLEKEK